MTIHLFGIRHHGPGCARGLVAALDELRPNIIVMEGPADAEPVLPLATHPEMKPPVALLLTAQDDTSDAAYYPFAVYSPEWQTLQWAHRNQVPVRLMDLPLSNRLAVTRAETTPAEAAEAQGPNAETEESPTSFETDDVERETITDWRNDPLTRFAEAAGYRDHEQWWDEQIERRENAGELFTAILEAMRAIRDADANVRPIDLLREAFMRKTLREVVAQKHEKIAVVCGAWHAPVLDEESVAGKRNGLRAKDDNERLKGLPKLKTSATWIPWTHSRLTFRSGYGAGVHSPGWYAHLWHSQKQAAVRWLATAARLLREKDLSASSAGVIEAVRLSEALAALRDLRSPGLQELNESILTVLCHGNAAPMELVRKRLEVGVELGEVPAETPAVPLAKDLAELQKSLRMKPSAEQKMLDLDLRKENDLARSHLLHRLNCLSIPWGKLEGQGSKTSTFHEIWRLEWQPEFAVAIIEANVWGNTIELAASAKLLDNAQSSTDLLGITQRLDGAILAGLKPAIDPLLGLIQTQAAISADVRHLLDALVPLARVARYGDVRGTSAEHVEPILVSMFERALVGLKAACSMLDDDAAERMVLSFQHAQEALDILNRQELIAEWQAHLRSLAHGTSHGLLRGWCCRLLLDKRSLDDDELFKLARLALSPANPPTESAAWVTGLLRGSGLLLLHEDKLWHVFDHWLSSLDEATFVEMLPLLRRAFADFSHAERRQMGEKVKSLSGAVSSAPSTSSAVVAQVAQLNLERAKRVLPTLAHILGVPYVGDHE